MGIAIALIVIVIGSIIFHFLSPWMMTPLASNWGSIDDTMLITLIITGIVFIAINFFIAFAVIKYRHDKNRKSKYEPENKKLEVWLTVITSIGIVAMLAPGLVVYSDVVTVPEEADVVEVVGQQWSWSFRFPGADGELGKSGVEHISIDNPFGVDPLDPLGQDDVLISGNRLVLPIDRPVKVLMRSKDVLHNFYVPQFRVKMDMVPGTVSYIWFTPTITGEFEILCAEFCGVGHFNMRGYVEVMSQQDFDSWLAQQPTFSQALAKNSSEALSVTAQSGKDLSQISGCLGCHNFTDSSIGPTWKNLYGKMQTLADGSQVLVDDAYLKESVLNPTAKIVKGFAPIMPVMQLNDLEMDSIIAYIKEKGGVEGEAAAPEISGEQLALNKGCYACHSIDGSKMLGPSWKGLFNSEKSLASGQVITVDEEYLKESIFQPNAKIVAGYPPVMPPPVINEQEAQAIIDFIKTL
ncbi:cytochrome c oxidase subunit II [Aliiglaciecola sp. M165]|uniref:cytochrome c oxidase subunit II n=1 Tax=Aliiglaciecola sp. M165 TaxID=2593649 RepID=UPI0011805861|nr:cytochrome c oxidase subunit II [Aliiglaciecola sp. M165]TRY33286.1 cytochrome c oxidase subunit II [Aliiglaciecola sp. M165]